MDVNLTFKTTGMVMIGGALGAALRYNMTLLVVRLGHVGFPIATLAVNIIGSFLMGLVAVLALRGQIDEPWRLFAGVGLLGGFTTFSAFSLELFQMIERGDYATAAAYALMSVVISLGALVLGVVVMRGLT